MALRRRVPAPSPVYGMSSPRMSHRAKGGAPTLLVVTLDRIDVNGHSDPAGRRRKYDGGGHRVLGVTGTWFEAPMRGEAHALPPLVPAPRLPPIKEPDAR